MSVAFGLCCVGLIGGMAYTLFFYFMGHKTLEQILGHSIPFYKSLGAIGILGFVFFLLFLMSSILGPRKRG